MAALQPAQGVVRIVFHGTLGTIPTATVMHMFNSANTAWSQSDANTIATRARTSWVTNFIPTQGAGWTLGNVEVTDLTNITGVVGVASGSTQGGISGFPQLPANCAAVVSWKVAAHFRGGHSRTYLPGALQNNTADMTSWNTTAINAWKSAAAAFLAAMNQNLGTSAVSMGMLRRKAAKVPLIPPIFYPWLSADVDSRIDSQRRRLGRDR